MTQDVAPAGTLYLVPIPIGNPGDITLRAQQVLRDAGIVAAEDTRKAWRLLRDLGADATLLSYHDHNEDARTPQLLAALARGTDVAMISDAGTPLLNDPGFRIVRAALDQGLPVRALPGACAPVTALIGSGLPTHRFLYLGFPPRRQAARRTAIAAVARLDATLVMFEAPHRIVETVADLRHVLGDRPATLARNLTKPDEEYLRGTLRTLHEALSTQDEVRGELTLLVGGAPPDTGSGDLTDLDHVLDVLLRHGLDGRTVRAVAAELTGAPRNEVYARLAERDRS